MRRISIRCPRGLLSDNRSLSSLHRSRNVSIRFQPRLLSLTLKRLHKDAHKSFNPLGIAALTVHNHIRKEAVAIRLSRGIYSYCPVYHSRLPWIVLIRFQRAFILIQLKNKSSQTVYSFQSASNSVISQLTLRFSSPQTYFTMPFQLARN
jgi:hypothetical protein